MNRETYLETALERLTDYIDKAGYTIPKVKVSAGWPSKDAFSKKSRCLGECWHKDMVEQEISHIFISPYLSDTVEVVAVLVHEIGHAILPYGTKHKKLFKQYMRETDLVGKATTTKAGDILKSFITLLIEQIGPYPHSSIDKAINEKKQTTRLRLWVCPGCETKVRAANDSLRIRCLDCETNYTLKGE